MSTDRVEMREVLIQELIARRSDVIAYLRGIGGPNLAEDAFQETFLVVQRKLDSYEDSGRFMSWVRVIARQVMLQLLARHARMRPVPDERLHELIERSVSEHQDGEDPAADLRALRGCLDRLDPTQRHLLDLRYARGRALAVIATELRRSEGAVQVALSRLRAALALCVDRQRRHA